MVREFSREEDEGLRETIPRGKGIKGGERRKKIR